MFSDALLDFSSSWFFPCFALLWVAMTGVLATLSGWSSLATRFRSNQAVQGERFRFASASLGARWFPVTYGNCLFVTVAPSGFGLSVLVLFRLMSPPLFIPWSEVESATEGRFLFKRFTALRVVGHWSHVKVYGRVGQALLEAYRHAAPKVRSNPILVA